MKITHVAIGVSVVALAMTLEASLLMRTRTVPKKMLTNVHVVVPDHEEGTAVDVALTRTAPREVDAGWSSSVQNMTAQIEEKSCSARGTGDYQGTTTVHFPLYEEGCALLPGRYYYRACWTPDDPDLNATCARSNVFTIYPRGESPL